MSNYRVGQAVQRQTTGQSGYVTAITRTYVTVKFNDGTHESFRRFDSADDILDDD